MSDAIPLGASAPVTEHLTGLMLEMPGKFHSAMAMDAATVGASAYDYWKEMLPVGTLHDIKGREWDIKPGDVDDAISCGTKAMSLGHEPLIQDDHFKPTTSYGVIKGYRKNERGGLEWLHHFTARDGRTAEENRDKALAKKVSVMLIPNYTDTNGRKFKWWPEHSASIFRPQVPYLADFQPALAASGQPIDAVQLTLAASGDHPEGKTMPDFTPLKGVLGAEAVKDKTDDQILALAAETLTTTKQALADQTEASGILAAQASAAEKARDEALTLAAAQPKDDDETDPKVLALSAQLEAVRVELTAANLEKEMAAKNFPAPVVEFVQKFIKDQPSLALSADGSTDSSIAKTLVEFGALCLSTGPVPKPGTVLKRPAVTGGAAEKTAEDVSEARRKELLAHVGM